MVGDEVRKAARRLADAGVDSPLLDAQLLMAMVLSSSRLGVIAHPERELSEEQLEEFRPLLDRRSSRHPLAYILGHREFYGIEFDVAPGVLVPRPETEVLVEECLKRLSGIPEPAIADIGAGSGAIAVALALNLPNARIYTTEISQSALKVARANVEKHDLSDRVTVLEGDLLEPLKPLGVLFDAIVSNPPYIPSGEIDSLQPEVSQFEPREALDGGPDGLDAYRRLLPDAIPLLNESGFAAVEVGAGEAGLVRDLTLGAGCRRAEIIPDLAGIERVVIGYR